MSKVMPRQKPHKSKQDYRTPDNLIAAIKYLLGIEEFDLDIAASEENKQARLCITKQDDALSDMWQWHREGEDISGWRWLNPPFTDIRPWAAKCHQEAKLGCNIAFLVPASVGSNWFRDYIAGKYEVVFLNGRPCFDPERPTWGYPKDCMLVLFDLSRKPDYSVWTWK